MTENQTYQIRIDCKKKLFRAYKAMPESELRIIINEVIAENRKISLDSARNQIKIRPVELRMFKERVDPTYEA